MSITRQTIPYDMISIVATIVVMVIAYFKWKQMKQTILSVLTCFETQN
jgi:hypothetical protein